MIASNGRSSRMARRQPARCRRARSTGSKNRPFDLLPLLRKASGVRVVRLDPLGATGNISFNHLYPPFDNIKLRRALYPAVNQKDYLDAIVGSEPEFRATEVVGVFPLGTPLATTAGLEVSVRAARSRGGEAPGRSIRLQGRADHALGHIEHRHPQRDGAGDAGNPFKERGSTSNSIGGSRGIRRQVDEQADAGQGRLGTARASPRSASTRPTRVFTSTFAPTDCRARLAGRRTRRSRPCGMPGSTRPTLRRRRPSPKKMQRATLDFATYIPTCQWYRATALRANVVDPMNGNLKVFWKLRKT